jgi:hypothetical protein
VRLLVAVLAASALAGCGSRHGGALAGKADGEACAAAGECGSRLCYREACATAPPAAATCAPPGAPRIAVGDPVAATEPPTGTCVAPVRDPVLASGELQDLGELAVGTKASFAVPAGAASVTIVSQLVPGTGVADITFSGFRLPNTVVPTDVLLPDGKTLYDDLAAAPVVNGYDDATGLLAFYGGASPIAGAFGVPNTSAGLDLVLTAGQVPAGAWSFTVNDWARECLVTSGCTGGSDSARYRVHVVTRPGPIAGTGTLDLDVYLVTDPAGRLASAAAAAADPQAARWVSGIAQAFAGAGICLGTVTFRDVPQWVRDRYAPNGVVDVSGGGMGGLPPGQVPPGCDDLSQLFTVGTATGPAVQLFLAEELHDPGSPGLGTTLGVDGSIPGPSGFPGTVNGGAIVGVFGTFGAERTPHACDTPGWPRFSCGTDLVAYVAAHEAGHWLGLYHPTEFDGTQFDPLGDTPTCPCEACAPRSSQASCAEKGGRSPAAVQAAWCTSPKPVCGGARNLMFWQLDPSRAAGELTREQGEVMRLNPAVR